MRRLVNWNSKLEFTAKMPKKGWLIEKNHESFYGSVKSLVNWNSKLEFSTN